MVISLEQGASDLHIVQLMLVARHHLLLHSNPDWFSFPGADLLGLSWKRGH